MAERYLTRSVFVSGGEPVVTYNSRDEFTLEREVREYLDQSGRALGLPRGGAPERADPALLYKNDELAILDPVLCFFMR